MKKISVIILAVVVILTGMYLFYRYQTNYRYHIKYTNSDKYFDGNFAKENYLTVSQLWAEREKYKNKEIVVRGKINITPSFCTLAGCGPLNPCCNTCSYNYRIEDDQKSLGNRIIGFDLSDSEVTGISLGPNKDIGFGCGGNECSAICEPLIVNQKYFIKGILHKANSFDFVSDENYYVQFLGFSSF